MRFEKIYGYIAKCILLACIIENTAIQLL